MKKAEIGIIGGSGLYKMEALKKSKLIDVQTPFGRPSDHYTLGELKGRKVAFLARHGRGHRYLPSDLNFRANIYGFKVLGVERIISVSAVGSLKEELKPGDMAIPSQFVDRTRGRISTFFGEGIVAHIGFSDPVCAGMTDVLAASCRAVKIPFHSQETYLCMEGPAFSTKAESSLYRSWGMGVIGMTNLQEAKLAREAEICYATLAMVTDYDCWHPNHDAVTVEQVVSVLIKNTNNAQRIISEAIRQLPNTRDCKCGSALRHAILTDRKAISRKTKKKLKLLIGKYVP